MDNCKLLFEKNRVLEKEKIIARKLELKGGFFCYNMRIKNSIFTGEQIYEIINVVNFVRKKYRQKVPIVFNVGEIEFFDKLVYILLDSIDYYLNEVERHSVKIIFKARHTIWTEGIKYTNMVKNKGEKSIFKNHLNMYHYRKCIPYKGNGRDEYLSDILQELYCFLYNNDIEEGSCEKLSEAICELVGNASEHGNTECLIDIDITDNIYGKKDDDSGIYYGLNVVVLNFSSTLFHEPLKAKINSDISLSERYDCVLRAKNYHFSNLNDYYLENDFYTISSFQHRISGSKKKNEVGGTGLTSLLNSLEENSDTHLCYMLSGNRIMFFEKDKMKYDEEGFVSFNENDSYFSSIPDEKIFQTINTFLPGVAYNLNYAVKRR